MGKDTRVRAKPATDLSQFAGKWIAQGSDGSVLASADSLSHLNKTLIYKHHFSPNNLPPAWLVPEDGDDVLAL